MGEKGEGVGRGGVWIYGRAGWSLRVDALGAYVFGRIRG